MRQEIVPAIIASSQKELEQRISKVKDYANVIQLDVMDGKFVPKHSLDFNFKLPEMQTSIEAHLMVEDPEGWIRRYADRVDTVLIHVESCRDMPGMINLVKDYDKRVGFALKPETAVETVKPYLERLDHVLVLTVHPGKYGSPFVPEALEKVKKIRALDTSIDIEVDGHITPETIGRARDVGANMFVSGSYIVNSDNPEVAIKNLEEGVKR